MLLADADRVAARIVALLKPYCDRIEIAGSVRRRKPDVGDIEIVCIPKTFSEATLFGPGGSTRDAGFAEACHAVGTIRKGDPFEGKYIQIMAAPFGLPDVQVDLFTSRPENWGLIFAMRTGSARFSHEVLANGWCCAGFHSIDGMLHRRGLPREIPVREEADLFNLIGVPWVKPEDRT